MYIYMRVCIHIYIYKFVVVKFSVKCIASNKGNCLSKLVQKNMPLYEFRNKLSLSYKFWK
jgi:hypothetical protein